VRSTLQAGKKEGGWGKSSLREISRRERIFARPRFPPPPNFVPVKLARRPKLAVSKIYKNMYILITNLAGIIVFVNLFT